MMMMTMMSSTDTEFVMEKVPNLSTAAGKSQGVELKNTPLRFGASSETLHMVGTVASSHFTAACSRNRRQAFCTYNAKLFRRGKALEKLFGNNKDQAQSKEMLSRNFAGAGGYTICVPINIVVVCYLSGTKQRAEI